MCDAVIDSIFYLYLDLYLYLPDISNPGSPATSFINAAAAFSCWALPLIASHTLPSAPPTPPPATTSADTPVNK